MLRHTAIGSGSSQYLLRWLWLLVNPIQIEVYLALSLGEVSSSKDGALVHIHRSTR